MQRGADHRLEGPVGGQLTVRDTHLAAGLRLTVGKLRDLLSSVAPARHLGGSRWYRWVDLGAVIESKAMWTARREGREKLRGQVTGSRYWVSGYSQLVAQWHPRNEKLPFEVSHGSHAKAWWLCKAGPDHEWQADVSNRVRGAGCPFCTNRRVSVTNSLSSCHPEVAAQWHPSKNGSLRPDKVVRCAKTPVWWKCPEGPDHEWRVTVHARTSGGRLRGCPMCGGSRAS
jgi:hypothetical protein